jgi:hypothetical protein
MGEALIIATTLSTNTTTPATKAFQGYFGQKTDKYTENKAITQWHKTDERRLLLSVPLILLM